MYKYTVLYFEYFEQSDEMTDEVHRFSNLNGIFIYDL